MASSGPVLLEDRESQLGERLRGTVVDPLGRAAPRPRGGIAVEALAAAYADRVPPWMAGPGRPGTAASSWGLYLQQHVPRFRSRATMVHANMASLTALGDRHDIAGGHVWLQTGCTANVAARTNRTNGSSRSVDHADLGVWLAPRRVRSRSQPSAHHCMTRRVNVGIAKQRVRVHDRVDRRPCSAIIPGQRLDVVPCPISQPDAWPNLSTLDRGHRRQIGTNDSFWPGSSNSAGDAALDPVPCRRRKRRLPMSSARADPVGLHLLVAARERRHQSLMSQGSRPRRPREDTAPCAPARRTGHPLLRPARRSFLARPPSSSFYQSPCIL